jgi:rod shape-determining protein MreC
MKTLIKFFLTYGIYFLFGILEISSLLMVVNYNHFQRTVFLSSCNNISATLYSYNQSVWDYFGLKQVNEELSAENAALRSKLILAESQLSGLKVDSSKKVSIRL